MTAFEEYCRALEAFLAAIANPAVPDGQKQELAWAAKAAVCRLFAERTGDQGMTLNHQHVEHQKFGCV